MNLKHYSIVFLALAFCTLSLPVVAETPKPNPVGKKNAADLITSAKASLAYTTKAVRGAGEKLSPTSAAAKPFLLSLKKIDSALNKAESGIAAKNPDFFKAIDSARASVAEMQATWDLTGSDDEKVIAGAKKLGGDIVALHENYSPLAARRRQGGELSAEEAAKFSKIRDQQKELEAKIAALAEKYKDDKALAAGLKQIRSKSSRIAKSGSSVPAYVDSISLLSSITGLINGFSYFLPSSARTEWQTITTLPSTWSYQESYSSYSYNWSSLEESVEIYDSENIEVSESEVEEESNYLEETDVEMTEEEQDEVAQESDELSEEDIESADMESEQEEVADAEEAEEMSDDSGSEDSTDDASADDGSGDDVGGDDGSGDDVGGDDGGGDDGGGDDGSGDDGSGDDVRGDDGGGDDGGGDDGGGDDGGGEE